MSTPGAGRVSPLERRSRLLLCSYPTDYRRERGEEMIGTLLEATPPGRSWPLPRDIRGLVVGGLRARAVLTRRLTTAANLRVAVLAGVAAYLAFIAVHGLTFYVLVEHRSQTSGWPPIRVVADALILATVMLAWLTRNRAVILACAVPAAAFVCLTAPWRSGVLGHLSAILLPVAALALLAGGTKRPGSRWMVPVGLLAVSPLLLHLYPHGPGLFHALWITVGSLSLVWIVVDARPAIAMAVFLLGLWLPTAIAEITSGYIPAGDIPLLVPVAVIAAVAFWRLRRQSARTRPSGTA